MQFSAEPAVVKEFERRLRVQDSVIKFLTVRIDETLKRLDKRKKELRETVRIAVRRQRFPNRRSPSRCSAAQAMAQRIRCPVLRRPRRIRCPRAARPHQAPAQPQAGAAENAARSGSCN